MLVALGGRKVPLCRSLCVPTCSWPPNRVGTPTAWLTAGASSPPGLAKDGAGGKGHEPGERGRAAEAEATLRGLGG